MSDQTGQWLKQRREYLNLSQEDVSARLQTEGLDVSRSMISHWENGRYKLPFDDFHAMKAIAGVFQVTVVDLLVIAGYEFPDGNPNDLRLTARERRLIKAVRSGVLKEIMEIALEIESEKQTMIKVEGNAKTTT